MASKANLLPEDLVTENGGLLVMSFQSFEEDLISPAPPCDIVTWISNDPILHGWETYMPSYSMSGRPFAAKILGPCHRIYCPYGTSKIILWNPSSREVKDLPPVSWENYFGLGFDFDPKTKDYKVFIPKGCPQNNEGEVDIYSLKSNTWRKLNKLHGRFPVGSANRPLPWPCWTLLDGVSYWLCSQLRLRLIIAFDIVHETLHRIPAPNILTGGVNYGKHSLSFDEPNVALAEYKIPFWIHEQWFDTWALKTWWKEFCWNKMYRAGPWALFTCIISTSLQEYQSLFFLTRKLKR